jgi:hypothetical protein
MRRRRHICSFIENEETVDTPSMRPASLPAAFCFSLWAAALLALTAVGASAAENDNRLAANLPAARAQGSLLHRLLTWPKKEDTDEKADGNDSAEKTDKDKGGNKEEQHDEEEKDKEEPLESDRPDFTESSTTVGYRRLQIESGYTFTQAIAGDPSHNSHDLPELLVRYGLAERLELRVAWDEGIVFDRYIDRTSGRVVTESGSSDMDFGFKYAISRQDKWRPQMAVIVSVSAPVGAPSQSSRQVDPRVDYLYSWEFTKKLSLNCSTGNQWTAESGDHYSLFFQSASVEYELTKKLHMFNEWYVLLRRDFADNRPQHYYDGGFTYLVTPNFQLDWRAGVGLSNAADGFFTGCGFVIRR